MNTQEERDNVVVLISVNTEQLPEEEQVSTENMRHWRQNIATVYAAIIKEVAQTAFWIAIALLVVATWLAGAERFTDSIVGVIIAILWFMQWYATAPRIYR